MEIYNINLCILTFLSILELLSQHKFINTIIIKIYNINLIIDSKKVLILIIAFGFVLLSALRDVSVGRDLINYIPRYCNLGKGSWSNLFVLAYEYSFEYGFAIFCKILYLINPDPSFFIIISSIIVGIGFYQLSKLSKMPINTYFIIYAFGFFGSSMNIIRQFLAFSILVFSIKYIIHRKFWKFLITVIIAMTIHTVSFLFLILYFVYNIKFDKKSFLMLIISSGILAICGNQILSVIVSYTSYAGYLSGIGHGSGESTLIFLLTILFGVYIYRKKIFEIDIQDNLCIWSLAISIVFNSMALSFGILARVMSFFTPFTAVLVPDLIYALKRKKGTGFYLIIGILMIIFYVLYFKIILIKGDAQSSAWYPYIAR